MSERREAGSPRSTSGAMYTGVPVMTLPRARGAYGGGLVGGLASAGALVAKAIFWVMARLLAKLELRSKYTGGELFKNYACVAVKR